jgi:RHS repeat-associated protein
VDDAIKIANPGASRASAFLHVYDLANNPLKTTHIDGGIKTMVIDGAGLPLESRDAKGALVCNSYDELLRPLSMWARDNTAETATMRQHLVYGDTLSTPEATNHRGQVYKHYDEAGLTEFVEYDFKGNLLEKIRKVIKDSEILGVFAGPPTNWEVPAYRVDWTGLNETALLETDEYRTDMSYDGLSRPIEVTLPLDLDSERKLVVPTYNRSGAMETISLDGEVYVSRIAYNAKGQRVLLAYGNGIMTRFAYDPVNFRLLRQRSEKFTYPSGFPLTYEAVSGSVKQDCEYLFDLSGNIVGMSDESPNAGFNGAATLDREFSHDALYRLLTATGREAANYAQSSDPSFDYTPDTSHQNSREYTRTYTYDQLGNMLKLHHDGGTGNTFNRWFNDYDVSTTSYHTSNFATKVKYGSTTITNGFDANGNMVSEGSSRHFEWDFADQMRVYRTQTGTSEPTVFAHYLYDAGGVRVKKIVRKSTGNHEVTVYIDGVFEYLYLVNSSSTKTEEKNEIHVMDGRSRIARREVFGASWTGLQTNAVKYVLEDHLGNASFTLTDSGGAYRREEYFPFGETSFGSYSKKRFRFCGKERDEESGLYYYGARYYMPWQCRFVSVDPLAAEYAFYTPYQYAGNQPIVAIDLDGLEPTTPPSGSPSGPPLLGTPPNTASRAQLAVGPRNPNNPANPTALRGIPPASAGGAGLPPNVIRVNRSSYQTPPALPQQPTQLNLDTATFQQVFDHIKNITLYENATNPTLTFSFGGTDGQYFLNTYFIGANFPANNLLAPIGAGFPNYSFTGTIEGDQQVSISFSGLSVNDLVSSRGANWASGPPPATPAMAPLGRLFTLIRLNVEGSAFNATNSAGSITISSPMATQGTSTLAPAANSDEGARVRIQMGEIQNFGVALYERWMTAAQLQAYPVFTGDQGLVIPAVRRSGNGGQYQQPWSDTYNYNGESLPSRF